MKLTTLILIFLFLSLLKVDLSMGQKNNMRFSYLTADDGLSKNSVNCIFRDSRDYMWFGTENGINKYDGSQIVVYRNDPKNPKSICGNQIICVGEDAEKNIWISTNSGLSMYDVNNGSFTSFFHIKNDSTSICSNYIHCLFLDEQQNFWIGGNNNEGLNKWNPKSKTFTRYRIPDPQNKQLDNAINNIVQDKKGNLWLASRIHDGIVKFDPNKIEFTVYEPNIPTPGDKRYLFIDNDGIIWISTFGFGLYSFNPETQKYNSYNSIGDGKGTNAKIINNFIQEDNNNLLITVDQGGINRYNKLTKSFEYIKYNPENPHGLNNDGILYMYKDKEDILWVGTSGGGVNIYNPKSQKFKLFRKTPQKNNSLCYNVINSIYEDQDGLIWINTDGGGVSVYNPKTERFKNYKKTTQSNSSLPCNVIRHVIEDKNQDFWFGTWECGLVKLNHNTNKFIQYLPDSPPPYNISGPSVWYHMVDHKGIIWLSIFNVGIDLLDPDKGIIKRIRLNANLKAYNDHAIILSIYEDSHRNIWLCTNAGIDLLDTITNIPKKFPVFQKKNQISAILEDKDGHYWASSTTTGLVKFSLDGSILKTYTETNGLPINTINGILEDENHNIWASSNKGICRINYRTGKITNYSKSDGLQGNQFSLQSCLKTKSGEMYFGGTNGLNSFFPDSIKDNKYLPNVYINEFLIFNKPVTLNTPDSPLKNVIEQTKKIVLNWKQSVFSFGFIAVNYTLPEKNLYAYKMEGFDKDWNYTDANRRLATYTNLNPGTYTFRVKASNNDGLWNEKGTSIKVTIIPPFWQTLLFKGGLIVTIAILIYLRIRIKFIRAKKESLKLESIVTERTYQLKAANKELETFAYSISHDLRAPLRSIDGFSQVLIDEYKDKIDEQGQDYLRRIRNASQRMADLIDDILNLSRVSSAELNIHRINLSHIANEIANELKKIAPERNVKFIIQDEIIVNADSRQLRIVLENLIGNAWKFTSKQSTADIEFGILQQEETITYFVRDNGAGFDMKYMQKLFGIFQRLHTETEFPGTGVGLASVQRIIQRHGGKVWAKGEVQKGATFYFSLPNLNKPSI